LGRISRRERSGNTRSGLALCEQRGKTAQALPARWVALKRGRELRRILSCPASEAGRGCALESALPTEVADGIRVHTCPK
jgi:hypothetical protein